MGCSSSQALQETKQVPQLPPVPIYSRTKVLELLKTNLVTGLTQQEAKARYDSYISCTPISTDLDQEATVEEREVIREGKRQLVSVTKIVPGDVMILRPGRVYHNMIVFRGYGKAELKTKMGHLETFHFNSREDNESNVYLSDCFLEKGNRIIKCEGKAVVFDLNFSLEDRPSCNQKYLDESFIQEEKKFDDPDVKAGIFSIVTQLVD